MVQQICAFSMWFIYYAAWENIGKPQNITGLNLAGRGYSSFFPFFPITLATIIYTAFCKYIRTLCTWWADSSHFWLALEAGVITYIYTLKEGKLFIMPQDILYTSQLAPAFWTTGTVNMMHLLTSYTHKSAMRVALYISRTINIILRNNFQHMTKIKYVYSQTCLQRLLKGLKKKKVLCGLLTQVNYSAKCAFEGLKRWSLTQGSLNICKGQVWLYMIAVTTGFKFQVSGLYNLPSFKMIIGCVQWQGREKKR